MIGLIAAMFTIGEMTSKEESTVYCNLLEKGDTVVVDSSGGSLDAFMDLGDCIYDKEVNVIVKKALSAAAYMVTASPRSCIYKDTVIGYHLPYLNLNNYKMELPLKETRQTLAGLHFKMASWGVNEDIIMKINYVSLMTPPDEVFSLVGVQSSLVLKKVSWCEDIREEG